MPAITPAGFQNHIQNPLAAVMYAVVNGAFQNARDARHTDYQIGQDRQRQANLDESRKDSDLDRVLRVIQAGGRVDRQQFASDPQAYSLVSALQGVASGRDQERAQNDEQASQLQAARIREAHARAARQEGETTWNSLPMRAVRGVGSELGDIAQALARGTGNQTPQRTGWSPMRGPGGEALLLDRATGRVMPAIPGQTPPPPVQLPPPARTPLAAPQTPEAAMPMHPQAGVMQDGDGVHGTTKAMASLREAGIDGTGSFAPLIPALTGPDPMQRAAALRAMPANYRLRAIHALRTAGIEE
jgi:hypothetical protein